MLIINKKFRYVIWYDKPYHFHVRLVLRVAALVQFKFHIILLLVLHIIGINIDLAIDWF